MKAGKNKRKRKMRGCKNLIENLDPLPHMNRVMQWGPNGYFATFEDMKKAECAIASALSGFARDTKERFMELYTGKISDISS